MVIGQVAGQCRSAVVTYRDDHVRIISDAARGNARSQSMKANEFDERFDAGKGMSTALDTARARRPGEEHRRVNVDFPAWMIAELDREATRLGVTRHSLIKVWIAEKLDRGDHTAA
jgi:hypothetical protein